VEAAAGSFDTGEWPPEVTGAFELAHLVSYCKAPHEVQRHAKRLAEEFGVVSIAELTDYADRAPMSVAGIVTSSRPNDKEGRAAGVGRPFGSRWRSGMRSVGIWLQAPDATNLVNVRLS